MKADRSRAALTATLAASAAALALTACGDSGGEPSAQAAPAPASATVARAGARADGVRAGAALGRLGALSGILVVREQDAAGAPLRTTRYRVLRTRDGDERLTAIGEGADRAYDASRGTETAYDDPAMPGSDGAITQGMPPGPPDRRLGEFELLLQSGSVARALAADAAASVEQITLRGRPAWRIAVAAGGGLGPQPGGVGGRVEFTIDRRSGAPLRVVETRDGRIVSERLLERLRIDPPIGKHAFRAQPKPVYGALGISTGTLGEFFRTLAFERAEQVVGYAPLTPGWLPAGFRRAETAVSERDPNRTGAGGDNPPTHDAVATAYRRGLQTVVVTTRSAGIDAAAWSDPIAAAEGLPTRPRRVCFRSGALAGACGELVVDPSTAPHLWAIADGLVVTVAGDLTTRELERVAGALRRTR